MGKQLKIALHYGKLAAEHGAKEALKHTIEYILKAGYTYEDIQKALSE